MIDNAASKENDIGSLISNKANIVDEKNYYTTLELCLK